MSTSSSIERTGFGTFKKGVVLVLQIGIAALGFYLMLTGASMVIVTRSGGWHSSRGNRRIPFGIGGRILSVKENRVVLSFCLPACHRACHVEA